jgi:hypothetical protein
MPPETLPQIAAAKKTAVLLAPPKFREETSKKAGRRSAPTGHYNGVCTRRTQEVFAATQHLLIN